jgi:hypothetical protein
MATYNENLITVRDQIAANLVNMTANPKPNYIIDGQYVMWRDLFDSYTKQLQAVNKLIDADAPQELFSYGYSPLDL